MRTQLQDEIERRICELPRDEQIALLERVIARLGGWRPFRSVPAEELAAMATDPEIRRELAAIEREFGIAEFDGLS